MPVILRSPRARSDLMSIWLHIASDNEAAATGLLRRIEQKAEALAHYPFMGVERPELGEDIRSLPVGSYMIFYRRLDEGIEIVRILHGAMDVPAQFAEA